MSEVNNASKEEVLAIRGGEDIPDAPTPDEEGRTEASGADQTPGPSLSPKSRSGVTREQRLMKSEQTGRLGALNIGGINPALRNPSSVGGVQVKPASAVACDPCPSRNIANGSANSNSSARETRGAGCRKIFGGETEGSGETDEEFGIEICGGIGVHPGG